MTFEQFTLKYLDERGMFEKDAHAVLEQAKDDDVLKSSMANRWNDDMEGYPIQLKMTFVIALKQIALDYIDANSPLAWYRDLFAK